MNRLSLKSLVAVPAGLTLGGGTLPAGWDGVSLFPPCPRPLRRAKPAKKAARKASARARKVPRNAGRGR